jgi:Rap1a immunity proteins
MRAQLHLTVLLLATTVMVPAAATDFSTLTSVELHQLCLAYVRAPESDDAQACGAYVRGFIEGSDEVMVSTHENNRTRPESFSERAWRTRLGTGTPRRPSYCLDATLPLREFVRQVLTQAERNPPNEKVSASALMYGTLSRFHRCSR